MDTHSNNNWSNVPFRRALFPLGNKAEGLIKGPVITGIIRLPNLGGCKFEGFRLNSALFGFGNIMTPVSALSRFHKHTLEILQIGPRCFCCQSDGPFCA